ncbi:Shedu anti-phage system protein SduA domain-containing protein [Priestia megaterium]|uniref:Shedu anti-phage system protein SduA domain-containing protein n=1 Tax=Priestia megaterium TaxID=1404 RepID=UPI003C2C9B2B
MKLYKGQDYRFLNKNDQLEYERVRESERKYPLASGIRGGIRVNKFHEYPKPARHYKHLFPNNYLDTIELQNHDNIEFTHNEVKDFIDKEPNEINTLNFINENEHYFFIASLLSYYDFGHHEAYLFKELQLNTTYRADYVLVGKGSGGYQFVFIELESPTKDPFKEKGSELSQVYQNGINQVKSWERFLQQQFSSLQPKFNEAKKIGENLPSEFINSDTYRRHYVVVAGRRHHYEQNPDASYAIRRYEEQRSQIKLLHYDNLLDSTKRLIGRRTF